MELPKEWFKGCTNIFQLKKFFKEQIMKSYKIVMYWVNWVDGGLMYLDYGFYFFLVKKKNCHYKF